jgi:NADP-dependent 3-hydroxy acid dehydrogenase YdfG
VSRVVAITGASYGIGAATARRLAGAGDQVVLAARGEDALAAVVSDIEGGGGQAAALSVDVTRAEDLVRLVAFAQERFGRLDVLVSNAGAATATPLAEGDLGDWDQMIDVNLRGVLHGIAAVLPTFQAQNSGHFVTVTSTAAAKWVAGQGVYAATKAGVRALCEVLRQEVGPDIRATMVCPGATLTEMIKQEPDPAVRAWREQNSMAAETVAEAVAYALDQPSGVNVAEIVVRSAAQL